MENTENFYTLDGNLYKIIKSNNNLTCFLYVKKIGFIAKANPFDIMLNGKEIDKKEAFKYIL